MADPLSDVAGALYALPPAEFVAARNSRAAEADDRTLATRIKELRRHAPAAWVVNLLARQRTEPLEELFAAGAEARDAQAALDRAAITLLSRRRRDLVAALVRDGVGLARDAGHPVPPSALAAIGETLDAGAADADAADAIRTARLIRPLETIGFEAVDLADAVAVPEAGTPSARSLPVRPGPRAIDDPDAELERARREADELLEAARREADEADDALARLTERVESLEHRRIEHDAEVEDLGARLAEARSALAAVEREAKTVERDRDAATRAAERTRKTVEASQRRREDLG